MPSTTLFNVLSMSFRLYSMAATTLAMWMLIQLNFTKTHQKYWPNGRVFRIWSGEDICSVWTMLSDQVDVPTKREGLVSFDSVLKLLTQLITDPIMIYPNIVNMLGEMTVDVNAICLDRTQTYILMIEQRQVLHEFMTIWS